MSPLSLHPEGWSNGWRKRNGPDWLKNLDWVKDYNASTMGQEMADRVGTAIEKFTLTKTKAELYEEGAIKRQILIAPVSTTKDISEDIQLQARHYWRKDIPSGTRGRSDLLRAIHRMSETPLDKNRARSAHRRA